MKLCLRIFCVLVGAATSAACGGQADSGGIPIDTTTPDGAAASPPTPRDDGGEGGAGRDGGAGSDAGACASSLTFLGNEEPIVAMPEAAPDPLGGAVVDGTYVLTSAVLYTGAGGASGGTAQTAGLTIRIAGGVAEIVADGGRSHATATYVVAGTKFSTHQTCPAPRDQTVGFTAKPGALVVFMPHGTPPSSTLVETLERR